MFYPPQYIEPQGTFERHKNIFLRGATLGLLGAPTEERTAGEMATGFLGSLIPMELTGQVVGPLIGATRAGALLGNFGSKVLGQTAAGGVYGGLEALSKGEPVLPGAAREALMWGGTGATIEGVLGIKRALTMKALVDLEEAAPGVADAVKKAAAGTKEEGSKVDKITEQILDKGSGLFAKEAGGGQVSPEEIAASGVARRLRQSLENLESTRQTRFGGLYTGETPLPGETPVSREALGGAPKRRLSTSMPYETPLGTMEDAQRKLEELQGVPLEATNAVRQGQLVRSPEEVGIRPYPQPDETSRAAENILTGTDADATKMAAAPPQGGMEPSGLYVNSSGMLTPDNGPPITQYGPKVSFDNEASKLYDLQKDVVDTTDLSKFGVGPTAGGGTKVSDLLNPPPTSGIMSPEELKAYALKAMEKDGTWGPQRTLLDDYTGPPDSGAPFVENVGADGTKTVVPVTPESIAAVQNVSDDILGNARTGTQFTPEEAEFLTKDSSVEKLERVAIQREANTTDNITAQPTDEAAQKLVDTVQTQTGQMISIKPSKSSTEFKGLLARNNMTYEDWTGMKERVNQRFMEMKRVNDASGAPTDETAVKVKLYEEEFRRKCFGGGA
jgi:hypothetical protein